MKMIMEARDSSSVRTFVFVDIFAFTPEEEF
jgi:hypothetical protein